MFLLTRPLSSPRRPSPFTLVDIHQPAYRGPGTKRGRGKGKALETRQETSGEAVACFALGDDAAGLSFCDYLFGATGFRFLAIARRRLQKGKAVLLGRRDS